MRNIYSNNVQNSFHLRKSKSLEVRKQFDEFSDGTRLSRMIRKLKMLISADRNGDWNAHLQAAKELLPIFAECDSMNYLRYGSWYLDKNA